MEATRFITGLIIVVVGVAMLFSREVPPIIAGLVFIAFGLIIIFNKKENVIEQIKSRRSKK